MNANQINREFRKAGLRARIVRGEGYYYWLDDKNSVVPDADSVYVYRASDLSLDQWLPLAREVDRIVAQQAPAEAPTSALAEQYDAVWRQLPENVVLLARLGDFYEVLGEDAKRVAVALGKRLTSRNGVPMVGIPVNGLNDPVLILLRIGLKIAIVDFTNP
jgi:hypothetical protein